VQILQFQATNEVNQGDLGIARVDVSDLQIDEVEAILDRRGILKVVQLLPSGDCLQAASDEMCLDSRIHIYLGLGVAA